MSNAEDQAKRDWELKQGASSTTEGVIISVAWSNNLVLVDMAGVQQSMPWHGPAPWPGDRVRVVSAGLRPMCSLIQGAPMGTVATTGSGLANVTGDDGLKYAYPYLGAAPAGGARVRIDHGGRVVLAGAYSVEPPGSAFIPEAIAPPASGQALFAPAWSGNWRYGTFQDPAAQTSISRAAAYGYGTAIRDTIPNGATITQADLYLVQEWDEVPGVNASLGAHGFAGRPGSFGDGNVVGTVSVPGGDAVVNVLGGIADGLKTGTYFGVGFRSGNGWRQYQAAPLSGRLFMKWS